MNQAYQNNFSYNQNTRQANVQQRVYGNLHGF